MMIKPDLQHRCLVGLVVLWPIIALAGGNHYGWCHGVGNLAHASSCSSGPPVLPKPTGSTAPVVNVPTPVPTNTPITGSASGTATQPQPMAVPTPVPTMQPSMTPTPTPNPTPVATPAMVPQPMAVPTPVPTMQPSMTPTPTPTPTPVATPAMVPQPMAVPTPVPTMQPSMTPTPTPTPTPVATPAMVPQPMAVPTPAVLPATQTMLQILPAVTYLPLQPVVAAPQSPQPAITPSQTPVPTQTPAPVLQPAVVQPLLPQGVSLPSTTAVLTLPTQPITQPSVIQRPQPQPTGASIARLPQIDRIQYVVDAARANGAGVTVAQPGRQVAHASPRFANADASRVFLCAASGFGWRRDQLQGDARRVGVSPWVRVSGELLRDLPVRHPRHADCLIVVERRFAVVK